MRLVHFIGPQWSVIGSWNCDRDVSIAACGTMLNSTVTTHLYYHVFALGLVPVLDPNGLSLGAGVVIELFQLLFVALC